MQTIFIMIKAELGEAYTVADRAVEVDQVSELHSISGQYDLLLKCYLNDDEDIGHFVTGTIQRIPGIRDTFTLLTFRAFKGPER